MPSDAVAATLLPALDELKEKAAHVLDIVDDEIVMEFVRTRSVAFWAASLCLSESVALVPPRLDSRMTTKWLRTTKFVSTEHLRSHSSTNQLSPLSFDHSTSPKAAPKAEP
jgi:hypothetical protein